MAHTLRTFMTTKDFQVTTDEDAAHYEFMHLEDYANGYRMKSFCKDGDDWQGDWEFTVYSKTKTRAEVLAKFQEILAHQEQERDDEERDNYYSTL